VQVNTLSKNLMFSTVRITARGPGNREWYGTAFIMDVSAGAVDGSHIPMLVTNRHVVGDAVMMQFEFTKRAADDDQPMLGETYQTWIVNAAAAWTFHPDPAIDVAVMPLADVIRQVQEPLFYRPIPVTWFPTPEVADGLDALEDITFIGYPNGEQDTTHKTPIFRRGITATPVALPFSGRPVFLIDGSVFGGSSGSPALILNEGSYKTPDGLAIGTRVILVGIVAETMVRQQVLPLQVAAQPHTRLSQELNLGVVFNWSAIDGTIDALFEKLGEVRPTPPQIADGTVGPSGATDGSQTGD